MGGRIPVSCADVVPPALALGSGSWASFLQQLQGRSVPEGWGFCWRGCRGAEAARSPGAVLRPLPHQQTLVLPCREPFSVWLEQPERAVWHSTICTPDVFHVSAALGRTCCTCKCSSAETGTL